MNYKAVLTDLDGTIFLPDMSISPRVIKAINQLKRQSIQIIPVTSRDYTDIRDFVRMSGIESTGVYSGGSEIVDSRTDKSLWSTRIDFELCRELIPQICYFAETIGFGEGRVKASMAITDMIKKAPTGLWVEFLSEKNKHIEILRQKYTNLNFHITTPQVNGTIGLHITPAESNKYHTTRKLLSSLGVSPDQTIAIGDGMNDLPLFELARVSVAMGNASHEVKEKATYVTYSVQEDGFEHAMTEHVLRQEVKGGAENDHA